MNKSLFAACIATALFIACDPAKPKEEKPAADTTAAVMKMDSAMHYDIAMVDNKKDPSCGMPLTAGIGDTAHYKNKVYGFCSKECKAEFEKNPEAGVIAAELKK